MGKPPERDYSNRTKNYSNRTFYACNLLIIIGNPWIVFTFFKEWAFLGFKASSFTHWASPQTVWKVSARVEKSVPIYRGDNEFSILTGGYFYFIRQSPPRMVSIGERSSPPENFGKVQNSGEIPDIIKRRKGLIYQSFWLFCKRLKKFGGISRIDVFGEEGVRRWHMTDEKRHLAEKTIKDYQLIF